MYNKSNLFDGFEIISFPRLEDLTAIPQGSSGFVYTIFWVTDGREIPFYVGQTHRFSERIKDYCRAYFKACTDFRVGNAVSYFQNTKNHCVVLKYKHSDDPIEEERSLIRDLHLSGMLLLNDLAAYDYNSAKEEEERIIVQRFCDALMRVSR